MNFITIGRGQEKEKGVRGREVDVLYIVDVEAVPLKKKRSTSVEKSGRCANLAGGALNSLGREHRGQTCQVAKEGRRKGNYCGLL